MGWGRAAPGAGGALGVAGGFFLLGAGLVLVLLLLDVGISRDLARLREHQERLWESVPGLWQMLAELQGRMEQEERNGRLRLMIGQRLGAEMLQLQREGRQFGAEGGAQEAELRAELGRLRGAVGGGRWGRGGPRPPGPPPP